MDVEEFCRISAPTFDIKDNILMGKKCNDGVETHSISEQVLDSLKKSPEFVGCFDIQTGQGRTFAEILDLTVRCALWLRSRGIGPGDVVSVSTVKRLDDYVPFFATYYVGGIYNPWYYDFTPSEVQYFFEHHRPKIMFTSLENISLLSAAAKLVPNHSCEFVCFDSHPDFLSLNQVLSESTAEMVSTFQPTKIENSKMQTAAVMFTSGTTGIKKGPSLSYEIVANDRMKYLLQREERRVLCYADMSWISGSNVIISCITSKCTRFIHTTFDPDATCQIIQNYKIDWMLLTPRVLTRMCQAKVFERYNLTCFETIIVVGSRPSSRVLEEARSALPHTFISNAFGMTEVGGCIAFQTKDSKKCDSIGYIVETGQMKVVDVRTGKTLGPNEQGELCFKLNFEHQKQTENMIDSEGWLHTGDVGYYTTSGEIIMTDRLKYMVIIRGRYVSALEIELCLLNHPAVLDAAVVGVTHEVDGERPFAFVKLRPGVQVTAKEIEEFPCDKIDIYSRISGGVVFVEEILYTNTGKKCMEKMKKMAQEHVQLGGEDA